MGGGGEKDVGIRNKRNMGVKRVPVPQCVNERYINPNRVGIRLSSLQLEYGVHVRYYCTYTVECILHMLYIDDSVISTTQFIPKSLFIAVLRYIIDIESSVAI